MQTLADQYAAAGEYLSSASLDSDFGDAVTLLNVLAFEILLKAVLCADTGFRTPETGDGHNYNDLWGLLLAETTASIVAEAKARDPVNTNFDNMHALLQKISVVFKKGRYSYELNDGRSDEQARLIGLRWIERGAPAAEADLDIPAREIFCISFAMREHLERLISAEGVPQSGL